MTRQATEFACPHGFTLDGRASEPMLARPILKAVAVHFLENLSAYLRQVGQGLAPQALSTAPEVGPAIARGQLIHALERLEQSSSHSPQDIAALLHRWQQGDRIVHFAKRLAEHLRQSFGKDASPQQLEEWVGVAIARQVSLDDELSSRVRTLELDRLSKLIHNEVFLSTQARIEVSAYASAVQATRGTGSSLALTPIGRLFLELSGRDTIRWLLHAEVVQSKGPDDPWRLSRETARELLLHRTWDFEWSDGPAIFDVPLATLQRLDELGLLSLDRPDEESDVTVVDLTSLGDELLAELAREGDSPMSVLAQSLLADMALAIAQEITLPHLESPLHAQVTAAAEATARQARLVAHELRNTLVPVKTALGALYREVLLEPPGDVLARRRESIDRGIDSAFRFVDQLVQLSKLAAIPPESFDPLAAIRDALAAIQAEFGHPIELLSPATLPPVSGHRVRMVMALANVLRNATQAVPPREPRIRLQIESVEGARAVRLTIDDNGPGVPEHMRHAIFDEGVSLRPGGSGLGLALVREVFEKEMKGLVACDASPLGGARFVIRMPATGLERP